MAKPVPVQALARAAQEGAPMFVLAVALTVLLLLETLPSAIAAVAQTVPNRQAGNSARN